MRSELYNLTRAKGERGCIVARALACASVEILQKSAFVSLTGTRKDIRSAWRVSGGVRGPLQTRVRVAQCGWGWGPCHEMV